MIRTCRNRLSRRRLMVRFNLSIDQNIMRIPWTDFLVRDAEASTCVLKFVRFFLNRFLSFITIFLLIRSKQLG